jgi:hypothetical protein
MTQQPTTTTPEAWELEDDVITAPNIILGTPKRMYKRFVWSAIREAMDLGGSDQVIWERVKAWNRNNNPRLSEPHLEKMTDWAITHWTDDIPLA